MPPIKTVPAGSVPRDKDTGEDVFHYQERRQTWCWCRSPLKTSDGRMVNGLLPKDFTVLENGQKQHAQVLHQRSVCAFGRGDH